MKFHLMIVDDEATMRKGLSSFIDWESIDCTVTSVACDGAEAIRQLQNLTIDIVIADIKMPEVDGLDLAKYIYENYPQITVIILTGYAEFDYAKTAIRYNVSRFLVKPISKDEIVDAVKEAQQKILLSKEQDSIAKNEKAFLKEQLLQEMVDGPITSDTLQKLNQYGLSLETYYVVAFQLSGPSSELNQLKELIINQEESSYCFHYNNLILSIYYQNNLNPIIENCNEMIQAAHEFYHLHVSAAISQLHTGAKEFQSAASEAIHTLSLTFYSSSSIAVFDRQNIQAEALPSADIALIIHDLETALLKSDPALTSSIITTLFSKLKNNFVDASEAKNICAQIYYLAYRVLSNKQMVFPSEDFLAQIRHSSDIFQLETVTMQFMQSIQNTLDEHKYSQYVQNTIRYIQAHLSDNISLKDVAKNAHVNESYLSRIFRKECGYSITEYITNLRIEKAKELLSNGQMLTYEVSSSVGIQDSSYFSYLFKKHTGLSPTEYRNQFVHQN